MGWTTTDEYELRKDFYTIQGFLDRQFASNHPGFPRFEVQGSSLIGGSEYYAAIRRTDRATGERVVFALIAMVSYEPDDPEGQTLGWKEMTEFSHPHLCNCPQHILVLLDPTDDTNALAWREACRKRNAPPVS